MGLVYLKTILNDAKLRECITKAPTRSARKGDEADGQAPRGRKAHPERKRRKEQSEKG